jgi:RNA polymerase sigma-70 factor (ECF subfamily)
MSPTPPATVRSQPPTDDDAVADFARVRSRLLGIAYRVLGNWSEAEDIVQDAWVRWQTCDRSRVLNPTAFLVTTTTRLAINTAQSARLRRESYVGGWSAEPADSGDDPTAAVERSEALARGVLLLVQRLSPTERAAYVLRHAFDYSYPEIAEVLQTSEPNARQLVSRASKHLTAERRETPSPSQHAQLLHAFVAASRHGDVAPLEHLFGGVAAVFVSRRSRSRCAVTTGDGARS